MDAGILYLIATPIGNLGDFSPRAQQTISTVDFIAAEDTRVTKKLLAAFDLPAKPMVSYFEHNRRQRGEEILSRLLAGESCALMTDAGMPAISDPGEDLVALCAQHGIMVCVVPGCCAAVCALAASGLPTGRWCFEGFLSMNKKVRREHLESLKTEKRTMIFYEAPHKLRQTLEDLCTAFGEERHISLSREITKLHEETLRFTLGEAREYFSQTLPRGEFVLIVEGAAEDDPKDEERMAQALVQVQSAIEKGETLKDAVKRVSADVGVKKNALYQAALEMQQE